MAHHCALDLSFDRLDVMAVDDSQNGHTILRSVLSDLRVQRLRMHKDGRVALREMVEDPPNLLVTDWLAGPFDGCALLRAMRHVDNRPLNLVPALVITAFSTRPYVQRALEAGANQILTKPLSARDLRLRIEWILRDARQFRREGERMVITGVEQVLARLNGEPLPVAARPPRAQPERPDRPAAPTATAVPGLAAAGKSAASRDF